MDHKSKTSVRTLTVLALLTAMSIIFARVFTISTGFVRFNLGRCRCCWPLSCLGRAAALP